MPDEPRPQTEYLERTVLATVEQHTGNVHTKLDIARYIWRPEVAELVGYKSCIRLRRTYLIPFNGMPAGVHESLGVPEADWPALVEAIKSVKL